MTLTINFNFSYPNGGFLSSIISSIDMKVLVLIERVRLGPRMHSPHTLGSCIQLGKWGMYSGIYKPVHNYWPFSIYIFVAESNAKGQAKESTSVLSIVNISPCFINFVVIPTIKIIIVLLTKPKIYITTCNKFVHLIFSQSQPLAKDSKITWC